LQFCDHSENAFNGDASGAGNDTTYLTHVANSTTLPFSLTC